MGWEDTFKKEPKGDYLSKILKCSTEATEAILDSAKEVGEEERLYIFLEFIYFFLHLTDRFAFSEDMDKEQRDELMTELEELCISAVINSMCKDWPEDLREKINEEAMDSFYVSMEEYSKCKRWLAKGSEDLEGTLFWEFSKMIAELAGRENNPVFKMRCIHITINSLGELDIKSFIKKVKQ